MDWFVDLYLSGETGDRADPRVSPLTARDEALGGSPPTLVVTVTN